MVYFLFTLVYASQAWSSHDETRNNAKESLMICKKNRATILRDELNEMPTYEERLSEDMIIFCIPQGL